MNIKNIIITALLILQAPAHSLQFAEWATRALLIGVPLEACWKTYSQNSKIFPISIDDPKLMSYNFITTHKASQELNADQNEKNKIRQGMRSAAEMSSLITQRPVIAVLVAREAEGSSGGATSMKDIKSNKINILTGDVDFFKNYALNPQEIEATLYHEAGHIFLEHPEKKFIFRQQVNVASLTLGTILYFITPQVNQGKYSRRIATNIQIALSQYLIQKIVPTHYSNQCEQEADDFALAHCENPVALEAKSNQMRAHYEKEKSSLKLGRFSNSLYNFLYKTISTHPNPLLRAQRFSEAAQKLREKHDKQ